MPSFASRVLGSRSLFSWVFGTFFSDSTNTSGLLAVALVASVIYLYVRGTPVPDRMLDAVFIIVGFYFGGAVARRPVVEGSTEPDDASPTQSPSA
jgi:hypothetical protein